VDGIQGQINDKFKFYATLHSFNSDYLLDIKPFWFLPASKK